MSRDATTSDPFNGARHDTSYNLSIKLKRALFDQSLGVRRTKKLCRIEKIRANQALAYFEKIFNKRSAYGQDESIKAKKYPNEYLSELIGSWL